MTLATRACSLLLVFLVVSAIDCHSTLRVLFSPSVESIFQAVHERATVRVVTPVIAMGWFLNRSEILTDGPIVAFWVDAKFIDALNCEWKVTG